MPPEKSGLIRQFCREILRVHQRSPAPALHRWEKRGSLEASWSESGNIRQAPVYKLSTKDPKQLAAEEANGARLSDAVRLILATARSGTRPALVESLRRRRPSDEKRDSELALDFDHLTRGKNRLGPPKPPSASPRSATSFAHPVNGPRCACPSAPAGSAHATPRRPHNSPSAPLRRAPVQRWPSQKEKMVAAKRAPVGLKKPMERRLQRISHAHDSKIDRSAMRAARRKEPYRGPDHEPASPFIAPVAPRPAGCWAGVE